MEASKFDKYIYIIFLFVLMCSFIFSAYTSFILNEQRYLIVYCKLIPILKLILFILHVLFFRKRETIKRKI